MMTEKPKLAAKITNTFWIPFLKKMLAIKLSFLLLLFIPVFVCISPENQYYQTSRWINPGDFDLWEITPNSLLRLSYPDSNSLSPKVAEAVSKSPYWLQRELRNQFRAMDNFNIKGSFSTSLSVGDLDGDGIDDLLVSNGLGMLYFYKSLAIPGRSSLSLRSVLEIPHQGKHPFFIAVLDLEGKGYSDLFLSREGQLFHLKNTLQKNELSFSDPTLIYTDKNATYPWRLTALWLHQKPCLILGKQNGSLSGLMKENDAWSLQKDLFPYQKEHNNDEIVRQGVFVSSYANPITYELHDGKIILIAGGSGGDFIAHRIKASPEEVNASSSTKFNLGYPLAAMAFMDINHDGRSDIVYLNPPDPLMFMLNNGHSEKDSWIFYKSSTSEKLQMDLNGIGYHRPGNILYASGQHAEEIAICADFILSLDPVYRDEAVYCIAHMQTQDLLSYIHHQRLDILRENAESIYQIAEMVNYVEIIETEQGTSLSYATANGWKEMPPEIYYHYLVMLDRYLLVPEADPSIYQHPFFRNFLPEDPSYGTTLLSRVKDAPTLYEAAYQVLYWFKEDIGGNWQTGNKPAGWYYIYKNLLNDDAGIWCGEWSVIYKAAARAMNIPTIVIVAMGEDHQFNNFWADGWHHVDASSGEIRDSEEWDDFFDDPLVYYNLWKQRTFSWPMITGSDSFRDHARPSKIAYFPTDQAYRLEFLVTDLDGIPIDGAQIQLWSHWPIEMQGQAKPNISAVAYTNSKGYGSINQLAPQNFTIVVLTRIGSKELYLPLKEQKNQDRIHIIIPAKKPSLFYESQIGSPLFDDEKDLAEITLSFVSDPVGACYIHPDTGKTYVNAELLADFIGVKLSQKKKEVLLKKHAHFLRIPFDKKEIKSPNYTFFLDHFPAILLDQECFISIESMSQIFDLSAEWNKDIQELKLRYRKSSVLQLFVDLKRFRQKHIPWIGTRFQKLNYLEYWRSDSGRLQFYLMDAYELKKFLEGNLVDKGDFYFVDSDKTMNIEVPDDFQYPLYLVVYNYDYCTSIHYDMHSSFLLPSQTAP